MPGRYAVFTAAVIPALVELARTHGRSFGQYVQDSKAHGNDDAELLLFAHLQVIDDDEGEGGQYEVEKGGVCCVISVYDSLENQHMAYLLRRLNSYLERSTASNCPPSSCSSSSRSGHIALGGKSRKANTRC